MPTPITTIILAYNEARTVAGVVEVAKLVTDEVIVVDDGSSDATSEVAQNAGARVLRLPTNQGKSVALQTGLEAATHNTVLLLDADLLGLKPEHLHALIGPVVADTLQHTIGVFRGGGIITDFGNRSTPHLSGQRCGKRDWFLSIPDLTLKRWPEPAITAHLERRKIPWAYVDLPQLKQVLKEEKRGLVAGIRHRLGMYRQLLSYTVRRWLGQTTR